MGLALQQALVQSKDHGVLVGLFDLHIDVGIIQTLGAGLPGPGTGAHRLAAAHVTNHSLSNFDAVCQVAADEGKIRPEDIERLKKFRANPSDESWIR